MARAGFQECEHTGKQRQLIFDHFAMKDSLSVENTFENTIRHLLFSALEHCLYECPVVHSQRAEIPLLSEIDVVLLQNLFVSIHLNGFIVDDDAVEVEE